VRLTTFWDQMGAQFGAAYAQSVAKDYVLAGLGGRTVEQALAEGVDVTVVWRAVCEAFEVPERLRLHRFSAVPFRRFLQRRFLQRRRLAEVFTLSAAIWKITRPSGPIGAW
jgi:hypothetical protein